jgi:hypothetical protein
MQKHIHNTHIHTHTHTHTPSDRRQTWRWWKLRQHRTHFRAHSMRNIPVSRLE